MEPHYRGFFCNDVSIRFPYQPKPITYKTLASIWITYFIFLVISTEVGLELYFIVRRKRHFKGLDEKDKIKESHTLKQLFIRVLIFCEALLVGFGLNQLFTVPIKYVIGRLRPNFIDGCKLDLYLFNCLSNKTNVFRYITANDYFCRQQDPYILNEIRLSFPSNVASISSYVATFCMIYITNKWNFKGAFLIIRTLFQIIAIVTCIFNGASVITSHWNHPIDVIIGYLIGIFTAIITWICVSNNTYIDQVANLN